VLRGAGVATGARATRVTVPAASALRLICSVRSRSRPADLLTLAIGKPTPLQATSTLHDDGLVVRVPPSRHTVCR
jgi:hypothetical protein